MTLLLLGNTPVPIELPPPVALALDIAEAIGATTRDLQLAPDTTITGAETDALEDALRRTELFDLKTTKPTAIIHLRRIDPGVILATVEKPDGERLWVGRAMWPATEIPKTEEPNTEIPNTEIPNTEIPNTEMPKTEIPNTEIPNTAGDLIGRVAEYQRRRLSVASTTATTWARPIFPTAEFLVEHPIDRNVAPGDMAPVSRTDTNWVLMRGSAQVLDELEFAEVIQDHELVRAVQESRYAMRLKWVLGFGGVGVAAIAAGIGLYVGAPAETPVNLQQRNDMQTIGVSVAVLGAASAIVALFFPTVGTNPIQSASDAERRCDAHNALLMRQLRLGRKDLAVAPTATRTE